MSIIIKWDTKELKKFIKKLKGFSEEKIQQFNEDTVKEIAARTLAKIIAMTPVGEYGTKDVNFVTKEGKEVSFTAKANKVGGTLRRGWTGGENIDPYSFIMANSEVVKKGKVYTIIISNPVNYAPHVEYGHRTVNGTGWVEGKFMMTISEDEIQSELPSILEAKLQKFLEEHFDD